MSSNNNTGNFTFTMSITAKKSIIGIFFLGVIVFFGLILAWVISKNNKFGLLAMMVALFLPFLILILFSIAHIAYRQSCKRAYEKGRQEELYAETHLRPGTVLVKGRVVEVEKYGNQLRLLLSHKMIDKITNIEGLDQVVDLELLFLYNNSINKIEGLDKLTKLKTLSLANNNITTIEGLGNLVNLTYLGLEGNPIKWPEGLSEKSTAKEIVTYCQTLPS